MMDDPTSITEMTSGMSSVSGDASENSTGINGHTSQRRPTIILCTPIIDGSNSAMSQKLSKETSSRSLLDVPFSREKSFKKERRNSFIPVFYVCKVYIKANGRQTPLHAVEPLIVEKDWTFDDFITIASRHIDMSNATRAFTRLGNHDFVSLLFLHSFISSTLLLNICFLA